MKAMFDMKTGSEYTRTVRNFSKIMIFSMVSLAALMIFASAPAYSYDHRSAHLQKMSIEHFKVTPEYTNEGEKNSILAETLDDGADVCLPLLSKVRPVNHHDAMDRSRHSAGKAAALGLIFGVRYALAPTEGSQMTNVQTLNGLYKEASVSKNDADEVSDRSALAVAAYRQCQKEQALQKLNGFRWSR